MLAYTKICFFFSFQLQQHTPQQQQLSEPLQLLQSTPSAAVGGGHVTGSSSSSSASGQNLSSWQRSVSVSGQPPHYPRQPTTVSTYAGLQSQQSATKAGNLALN